MYSCSKLEAGVVWAGSLAWSTSMRKPYITLALCPETPTQRPRYLKFTKLHLAKRKAKELNWQGCKLGWHHDPDCRPHTTKHAVHFADEEIPDGYVIPAKPSKKWKREHESSPFWSHHE